LTRFYDIYAVVLIKTWQYQ